MKTLDKYAKYIPYLYFISVTALWFILVNRSQGLVAYPILLLGIPFLIQMIRPTRRLNFTLGITFVCLSSYVIIAYLSDLLQIVNLSKTIKVLLFYAIVFIPTNFLMALWMIRNSLKRSF